MCTELIKDGRGGAVDWFSGLSESESIQGQVFQFTMALVSPESDEGKNAARKLLAMGILAKPILKKVLETTLVPEHGREIARILAQMGDFIRMGLWATLESINVGLPGCFSA